LPGLFYVQEAPLLAEANTAIQSGDPAAIDAVLAKVQAENDALGTA
jgi:hypothetical protein